MKWLQSFTKLFGRKGLRAFNEIDYKACKRMNGEHLKPELNPGIRVEKGFVKDADEASLLDEVESMRTYAFQSQKSLQLNIVDHNAGSIGKIIVESLRVTGRPEASHQTIAPWKYGDDFDITKVPTQLLSLATRIHTNPDYNLEKSKLRDITINYRSNSMFKLDPHIDPPADGNNIFVIGLKSDVVFTFTPDQKSELIRIRKTKLITRTSEDAIALRSWTDDDIDVRFQQKDLLYFTSYARSHWKHAIRNGVEVVDQGIHDWWGICSDQNLFKRNPDRISIIFAFD